MNTDRLRFDADAELIEKNFRNVLCCNLESEFDLKNMDTNLCKLFQLAQISIAYLLQMRQVAVEELKMCKEKCSANAMVLLVTEYNADINMVGPINISFI